MRKTSLIDRELFRIFQELIDSIIAFVPEEFDIVSCFIELGSVGGEPKLFYHIGCPSIPDKSFVLPDDRTQRAGTNLCNYFVRNGSAFPGFRITLQRQTEGHWKNDIQRLDTQAAAQFVSPIPRPLEQ